MGARTMCILLPVWTFEPKTVQVTLANVQLSVTCRAPAETLNVPLAPRLECLEEQALMSCDSYPLAPS